MTRMMPRKPKLKDLQRTGGEALVAHLLARANEALARHGGPISEHTLDAFLRDSQCVRYPVRLAYDATKLEAHQFAQPEKDPERDDAVIVYLHPGLADRPDLRPLAVAYVVPVINYGKVITNEHAEMYGARCLGFDKESYYQRLCEMAVELNLSDVAIEETPS